MVSRNEFYDYEAYVKKFQGLPSTTDDTFTPEGLYCDLLDYIDRKIFPLSGYRVERPFYPGGNYETYDYKENSVVIDNPPFSICGKIRADPGRRITTASWRSWNVIKRLPKKNMD